MDTALGYDFQEIAIISDVISVFMDEETSQSRMIKKRITMSCRIPGPHSLSLYMYRLETRRPPAFRRVWVFRSHRPLRIPSPGMAVLPWMSSSNLDSLVKPLPGLP